MRILLLLLLVTLIVVGLACNTGKKGTETPEAPDPYAPTLHDIWVLETMDGKAVDREKPRPRLELFPEEGRIAGTGGCNQLFGQMEASGWQINFQDIGTTKMYCRELMETESRFLQLLQEADSYRIKELKLILLSGEETTLVFQKVD